MSCGVLPSIAVAPSGYKVVSADLERDREAIVEVWARNLGELGPELHRRKFDWYYRNNPCGRGRCWILKTEPGGQVVGTAGLGFRQLSLGERRVCVGVASDFAVDREHRSLQPALMLQRAVAAVLEGGVPLVYGLPNAKSVGVFRRVGFAIPASLQRYVKVLRVEPYLRALRHLPALGPMLAPLVAPLVNAAMRTTSAETWRRSGGGVIRPMAGFDDRWDALASRLAGQFEVTGCRSAEFLRWRYTDCPLREYATIGVLTADEREVLGYAVYYLENPHAGVIADFAACGAVAEELLGAVVRAARSRGAASLAYEYVGINPFAPCLNRLGFVRRNYEAPLAVLTAGCWPQVPANRWYFVRGDEDYN